MKKRKSNKYFPKIFLLLLLVTLLTGGLLFTNSGRETIGSLIEASKDIQNKLNPQEPPYTEPAPTTASTETPESAAESVAKPVLEPVAKPVQKAQSQPVTNSNSDRINQEQKTADSSKVIKTGLNNPARKQIALTFDIGWLYENTDAILNLLDENNVKATFFVRGLWVKDHPDLAAKIVNRGHTLENHSLTHGHMNAMTEAEIKNEIRKTKEIIKQTTGYQPQLYRPPYGEYDQRTLKILAEEGYPYTILWSVDSHDWAEELNGVKITKDYLVNRVLLAASDNGIILMHVGGYKTVQALPEIIAGLRAKGYELVKVNDML
ncbi:MAG: polysaccharide deacetylase family protein [Desulfosporosinus sp.]